MPLVTVIMPSRFDRPRYLTEAVQSIRAQGVDVEILIGTDRDAVVPDGLPETLGVRVVRAGENGQIAALNAVVSHVKGEHVAFLEDDDSWLPEFLVTALSMRAAFVSSTQLQINERGTIERINDFPTPSGWVMQRGVLQTVGPFSGRWHFDNEYLGRVGDAGIERVHLVESTAPVELEHAIDVRPWLAAVLQCGGKNVRLERHNNPRPLVIRRAHGGSGVSRISSDPLARAESDAELAALQQRFGRIPW